MLKFALALCYLLPLAAAQAADQPANTMGGGMMGGPCPMMAMGGPGGPYGMGPGGMGQGKMGQGGMGQGMMGQGGPAGMTAMVEGRLAFLQSALGITAAQQPAWQAYAEAVRAQLGTMQANHELMFQALQTGTAPERMQARIAAMSAMLAALQMLQPATEALYDALDAQQKVLADQLIGLDCGAL